MSVEEQAVAVEEVDAEEAGFLTVSLTLKRKNSEGELEKEEATFAFEAGQNLEKMLALYSEGQVYRLAQSGLKQALRAKIANLYKAGQSVEEIATALLNYQPALPKVKKPVLSSAEREAQRVANRLEKLSPEERAGAIAEMRALLAAEEG